MHSVSMNAYFYNNTSYMYAHSYTLKICSYRILDKALKDIATKFSIKHYLYSHDEVVADIWKPFVA